MGILDKTLSQMWIATIEHLWVAEGIKPGEKMRYYIPSRGEVKQRKKKGEESVSLLVSLHHASMNPDEFQYLPWKIK
jgi:hypothetical protein